MLKLYDCALFSFCEISCCDVLYYFSGFPGENQVEPKELYICLRQVLYAAASVIIIARSATTRKNSRQMRKYVIIVCRILLFLYIQALLVVSIMTVPGLSRQIKYIYIRQTRLQSQSPRRPRNRGPARTGPVLTFKQLCDTSEEADCHHNRSGMFR